MKIFRASGLPADPSVLKEHEAEYKARYDAIAEYCKMDMSKMHSMLKDLDAELALKYKLVEEIDLPTTVEEWQALIKLHGAPIAVAQKADDVTETVLMILDQAFV